MSVVALVLVVAGCLVVLACCLALASFTDPLDRLHTVTPATSLGGVLVLGGLAVHDATLHGVAKLLLTAALLALTGPAVGVATARAERARRTDGDRT